MKIVKAYTKGFKASVKYPSMIFLLYTLNFVLALTIAIPFYYIAKLSFGNSMLIQDIAEKFNYTVLLEFLNSSGKEFQALLSQIKWLSLIYLIFSIFLAGGILRVLNKEKFTMNNFFSGAGYNFVRFSGLTLVMAFIHIFIAILIYFPTIIIASNAMNTNESNAFTAIICGIIIHFLFIILLIIISDYSKCYLFLYDKYNPFKAIVEATKFVFKNFLKTYGLFCWIMIIPLIIFYLFYHIDSDINATTGFGIIFMFVVQQIFIIIRIWARIWIYSGQLELFTHEFILKEFISGNEKFLKSEKLQNQKIENEEKNVQQENEQELKPTEIVVNQVLIEEELATVEDKNSENEKKTLQNEQKNQSNLVSLQNEEIKINENHAEKVIENKDAESEKKLNSENISSQNDNLEIQDENKNDKELSDGKGSSSTNQESSGSSEENKNSGEKNKKINPQGKDLIELDIE